MNQEGLGEADVPKSYAEIWFHATTVAIVTVQLLREL
jgi:hypothetical protein